MGNSGRSSTGCSQCRKRKIKCDETRPQCKKCLQIKKPCPGYPFSIELQLRSDEPPPLPSPFERHNSSSSSVPPLIRHDSSASSAYLSMDHECTTPLLTPPIGQNEPVILYPDCFHPSAPQESEVLQVKHELLPVQKNLLTVSLPRHRSLTPPPRYDIQHQATCFFLHLFSYQASRLYGASIFDFLPDMLATSPPTHAIHQAFKAVSRLTLADRYSGQDPRLQTSSEYAKALSTMAVTMSDVDEAVKDETVTAVWLLGLYEAVDSTLSCGRQRAETRGLHEEWQSHLAHIRGAMRLLKLRGTAQFRNPRSEKIFRILKAAIQMRLFMLNSATASDFNALEVDAFRDEHEFVPSETANKATSFFLQTARHMDRSKRVLQRHDTLSDADVPTDELDGLEAEGMDLEVGMTGWSKPELGWDMTKVTVSLDGTLWSRHPLHAQYYFYSFWVFLYWVRYLIARIKLHDTLIALVDVKSRKLQRLGQPSSSHLGRSEAKKRKHTAIIRETTDQLIGLTAYALGDISSQGRCRAGVKDGQAGSGWLDVNVCAAMQLVLPFKVLQRSVHITPGQHGALGVAISQIADGLRRTSAVS